MTESIRVMHVVLNLDMGGLERIVDDLLRKSDRSEVASSVCCVEKDGRLAEELRRDGIEVISLEKGPGKRLKGFTRAFRLFRSRRPDVIHTHQVGALFYAGPAARLAGVPVVVHTEHGRNFEKGWRWRALGRIGARCVDRIFTVSNDIAQEAFRLKVYSPEYTQTVINGIDVERFSQEVDATGLRKDLGLGENDYVVGTVARLDPIKDQKTMIRAFGRLRRRAGHAHLLLVGDGPSRGELEALVRAEGLEECVHFAGVQNDVVPYLKLMDVFALSSVSEGIPLVILEAMAAGIPVVSTAVGGVPEIVTDGKTGRLVPAEDVEAFGRILVELFEDAARRRTLGQAGRELVEREYSLERMARTYTEAYRRLLDLKRPSGKRQGVES